MNVRERFNEHVEEVFSLYENDSHIVGVFLQGSQNYGLDYEASDVDTKAIILPTFEDLVFNRKPVSTTHVRENDEHIDLKDARLMLQTFRKQNINFIEILFTEYFWVNPRYSDIWKRLVDNREKIARYCEYDAVKCMKGMALEKYHALEHPYPNKAEVLAKFGYDPKQLHHILRLKKFMDNYILGDAYSHCLRPANAPWLLEVKRGIYSLDTARELADLAISQISETADKFRDTHERTFDKEVEELLNGVQFDLMYREMSEYLLLVLDKEE